MTEDQLGRASSPLSDDPLRLTNKVALVTGAARGIGEAAAELLGRFGASLALCDRVESETFQEGVEDLKSGAGEKVTVVRRLFDVREAEAADHFIGEVKERFGRVDVLVNNAGGTFASPLVSVSAKGEAALVAENFTQVTRVTRGVVPMMPSGGRVITVTSIEAHQAAPGYAVYAAMKAGLESLTKSLALELAPLGITVNSVAPDALLTGGESALMEQHDESGVPYRGGGRPPLGYYGTPADGAGAILFLCSELARFVTGATIHVDGGKRAAGGWHRTDVG